jgi:nitroreductase
LIKFHVLQRPKTPAAPIHQTRLNERNIAMNTSVIEAIERQKTTNLYDASKGIADEEIRELVRLATFSPTAFHLQNWRFIAVRSPEAKARLRAVAADQPKVTEAAVTFIMVGELAVADVMADRLADSVAAGFMPVEMVPGWEAAAKSLYFGKPQTQRDEAIRSATFGASGLIRAAQAMGLGTTPMIGFDPAGVSREFGLGDNEVPALLVAVGYPTEENWPQKPRRPISDVLAFA